MVQSFSGEPILARLRSEGRNLTWFCGQVGVSRHTFYRWMWGKRTPTAEHLRRMAEVLGVDQSEFFLPSKLPSGSDSLPTVTSATSVAS